MGSVHPVSVRPPTSSAKIWRGIRIDLLVFASVLAAFGGFFYLRWDLWEDQSAQLYMVWGMFHGLRPYVDLVDPNWPGSLIPHVIAYLISGVQGWGLRLLDLFFLYALSVATSFVLASWGTPLAARLVGGMSYLTYYMATDWRFTAQRESFSWPLFVIGAIPFLLVLGPADQRGESTGPRFLPRAWLACGLLTGLSLWIRPSPCLAIAFTAGVAIAFCSSAQRPALLRGVTSYFLGIALVTIAFIGILAWFGGLSGFIKWGIFYDLGPYLKIKMPWPRRVHTLWFLETSWKIRAVAVPLCAIGGIVAFSCRASNRRWRFPRRPIVAALTLVASGLITALLQGKLGSVYHLIPLNWSLAFLAATLWSVVRWPRWLSNVGFAMVALMILITLYCSPPSRGPTIGAAAASQIAPLLKPEDEVVEWGYSPSLLLQLQHRTPMAPFVGTAFLITSPPNEWPYRDIFDELNVALQNPRVKYLLIEHNPNNDLQPKLPHHPLDFLLGDLELMQTIKDQYKVLPAGADLGFDVLEHVHFHDDMPSATQGAGNRN